MTLRAILATIRRNWIMELSIVVVCLLAGLVLTYVLPKTYSTETQVLFQPEAVSATGNLPSSAASYVSQQMPTLSALADTASVLDPVAKQFGMNVLDLQKNVTTSVTTDTSIVQISVKASTADGAAKIANAVSASLVQQATDIQPATSVTIRGTVIEAPIVPPYPDSPLLLIDLLVGLFVGLLLAFLAVVLREALRAPAAIERETPVAAAPTREESAPRVEQTTVHSFERDEADVDSSAVPEEIVR